MKHFILALIDGLGTVRFFVLTALIFGTLFAVTTPPFQGSDESAHFLRAYQISEGKFVVNTDHGQIGGKLPASIYQTFLLTTTNPSLSFHPNIKYHEHKTIDALRVHLNSQQTARYDLSGTALYSPVAYAPGAVAILIGRLFSFPPVLLLFGARIAGLLAWIVLLGLSIRLMPRKKWAFVFLGLLPMALFQASVLNTDAVTLGSVALLLAYILHLREQASVLCRKQFLYLLLVGSITILSKQAMFVFMPLFLLLPRSLFSTRKAYILFEFVFIGFPLFIFGLWSLLIRNINLNTVYGSANGQNPAVQLPFIIHHPFSYLHVLTSTIINASGDDIARSLVGVFGWFDAALPWIIVIIAYALMALLIVGWGESAKTVKQWLGYKEKIIIVGVALLYWGAVNTSLYLYYSPVKFHFVYGIQGRYYYPLLLLSVPLLYGTSVQYKHKNTRIIAMVGALFLLIASFITIASRYFVVGAK